MFNIACPACGADVQYRSAASVMAVCQYCRSTLLRDAGSVRNIGRMSEILEDHTRIQINTCGIYEGTAFTVVGRIQLRYTSGFWNEWYVLFDDGTGGWLSDGSGQYVLTRPGGAPKQAPNFADIRPGAKIPWKDVLFSASDVRTAECVAGEGELPFQLGSGWTARVADFRHEDQFLTLDYSEGEVPQVFLGKATTLEALKCQLLRDADQITDTAGKLKGAISTLECPQCGSGIQYSTQQTPHLICPSCHAEVETSAAQASVLKTHDRLSKVSTSLSLGDLCKLEGVKWLLIGLMRCQEGKALGAEAWTEYLFFDPVRGFMWLVETGEGWSQVFVLNTHPVETHGDFKFNGKFYTQQSTYKSIVTYAAGAFNWRVALGDVTQITDYKGPEGTLSRELYAAECTWSFSHPISPSQLSKAFNKPLVTFKKSGVKGESCKAIASWTSYGLLGIVFFFFEWSLATLFIIGGALLMIWLPLWLDPDTHFNNSGSD